MQAKHMARTATAVFACKRGKDPEFLEMLVNALAETRAFATCRAVERYVDQDNPDVTVLWEKWEDRPSQEAYRAWRVQPGMVDMIGPYQASPLGTCTSRMGPTLRHVTQAVFWCLGASGLSDPWLHDDWAHRGMGGNDGCPSRRPHGTVEGCPAGARRQW